MVFIIGGAAQGKNKYANEQYEGYEIIHDYHEVIREQLENGEDAIAHAVALLEGVEDIDRLVIVCGEVGHGLVPMDAFERSYRETVGKVNCYMASKAKTVIRIVAGLPVRIK